jgi:prepilin-type N-terminal cleavage/methylation domain-containing protein/prepilin-type processing-associated H-X9-DG protein
MSWRIRSAFTLVELLVVIAIIGILAGLALAGVQAVRRAAQVTECSANLQQIGLAVQNYQAVHQAFPPSGTTGTVQVGWRPLLLPFIEQENLLRDSGAAGEFNYDFGIHWWEEPNLTLAATPIMLFQCPSVPSRSPITSAAEHLPRPELNNIDPPLAPTDYEAIMGLQPASINPHLASPIYTPTNRFSVMHRDSANRLTDIRDGISQTIMIVEAGGRPDVYHDGDLIQGLANDQGICWADSEGPFSLDLSNADGTVEGGGPPDCTFVMNKRNDNEIFSFHASGANFLFADGRVVFLSEDIDWQTMARLVTRAANDGNVDVTQLQ